MSHAEYVSKQLPVFSRLAMLLRQIPAVQTALSRLRALLRGRTNPEPVIVDTFLADASAVTNGAVEIDDVPHAVTTPIVLLPNETVSEPITVVTFLANATVVANDTAETGDAAPAVAQPTDESERETLIRRRWRETGIKMWNSAVHGAGHSALCIQGRVALLPPKPGDTLPGYDRLEFKLIAGNIVCEGFVVDPPERPRNRPFAGGGRNVNQAISLR